MILRALLALTLVTGCAHVRRDVAERSDTWTSDTVRNLDPPMSLPTGLASGPMEVSLGYRMRAGAQRPEQVSVTIAARHAVRSASTAPRWWVVLDGSRYDFGELSVDNFFGGDVTVMSTRVDCSVIERIAASRTVSFHFSDRDVELTQANLDSIRGLASTWVPSPASRHPETCPPEERCPIEVSRH